jgi:nitrite reductase/ring-hydroxylating ferredoxin subunit
MSGDPAILPIPSGLLAPGSSTAPFVPLLALAELPPGALRRVTRGDLDVLLAHTPAGVLATDDRCPHMSAPLSQGRLEDCVVDCPLHSGRFDLSTGDTVQFPTTGGLDAEGAAHAPWRPDDSPPRPEPTDAKALARAATRVRRLRYYPVRFRAGMVEVALPEGTG